MACETCWVLSAAQIVGLCAFKRFDFVQNMHCNAIKLSKENKQKREVVVKKLKILHNFVENV